MESNRSSLLNSQTSSEIQFTKISSFEKSCLNITKVECQPKKAFHENFNFINTIRIAKSIYEFSMVEEGQPTFDKEAVPNTQTSHEHQKQQNEDNATRNPDEKHEQHFKSSQVQSIKDKGNLCNGKLIKSTSLSDFSTLVPAMSCQNSLKPLTDQRFVDLISLLKIENQ